MTYTPDNEIPPVFDPEKFKRDHLTTLDLVDSVAAELGLELPETAHRPLLIKTNQPIEDNAAQIKRELWENPTLSEMLDTTIIAPDEPKAEGLKTEDGGRRTENGEKKTEDPPSLKLRGTSEGQSEEDSGRRTEDGGQPSSLTATPSHGKTEAKPKSEPTKDIQNEKAKTEPLPPFQLKDTLESVSAKLEPMELKGDDMQDRSKETGWLRVILTVILLAAFIAIDCYSTLYTVPTYMLVVRLGCFALGFIFAVATAWRAAGIKLAISLIIIALFLFHFNNNKPILSIVEKWYEHQAEAGASPSAED